MVSWEGKNVSCNVMFHENVKDEGRIKIVS